MFSQLTATALFAISQVERSWSSNKFCSGALKLPKSNQSPISLHQSPTVVQYISPETIIRNMASQDIACQWMACQVMAITRFIYLQVCRTIPDSPWYNLLLAVQMSHSTFATIYMVEKM